MWYLIEIKTLTKDVTKRLYQMRESNIYNYASLEANTHGKGLVNKPTDVPEGHTLKYFPNAAEIRQWREERLALVASGEMRDPPWAMADEGRPTWFDMSILREVHMPLLTADGQINFYPSFTHRKENRSETVSIGRFLKTFWSLIDDAWGKTMTRDYGELTDEMIRLYSEIPKTLTAEDVKFAFTPDEIEKVYLQGPSSCMSHAPQSYRSGGIHPVRAYGAGDLAVAYLPKPRDPNRFSQRALTWPAKKIYSRIYGTGPLEGFLKTLGYTKGQFHNARLLKIEVPGNPDTYVMPYVDWHDYVVERANYLRIFHKRKPHPLTEKVMITAEPRTTMEVWSGQVSTAGVASKMPPCPQCHKKLDQDSQAQGYSTCKVCRQHSRSCYRCGATYPLNDPRWTLLVTEATLQSYMTLTALNKHSGTPRACGNPTCMADASLMTMSGYHLIPLTPPAPVETPTMATDTSTEIEVF